MDKALVYNVMVILGPQLPFTHTLNTVSEVADIGVTFVLLLPSDCT